MRGKKVKRLRRLAQQLSPVSTKEAATIVKLSGAKHLEIDSTTPDGTIKGTLVGGNRLLDGNCVRKVHRTMKKMYCKPK